MSEYNLKEVFQAVREQRESKDATRKRKELAEKWAIRAKFDSQIIKDNGVSEGACRSTLLSVVLCSLTGDFSTAKQETLALKANYSLRTVRNSIKALRAMGLIYTKHNYKTDELGHKRRIGSYTIVNAFRKHFDKIKAYLQSYSGVVPVQCIVEKLAKFSVAADSASQLISFNKTIGGYQFLDTKTGELLESKQGIFQIQRETYLAMRGV